MKNKKMIIIVSIIIVLLVVASLVKGKEEKNTLNYHVVDDGRVTYVIDNESFAEVSEETNLVKIDIENMGIIIAELYPKIAPITVKNFKSLVKDGFYNGLTFHRVIKDFMIQTGDPNGDSSGGSKDTIKGEFSENGVKNDLSHTRGILSMARRGAEPDTDETRNSASSQFFIVHKDSTFLDGKYASFGKVTNGLDIVDKIAVVSTDTNNKPNRDITITSITFVEKLG